MPEDKKLNLDYDENLANDGEVFGIESLDELEKLELDDDERKEEVIENGEVCIASNDNNHSTDDRGLLTKPVGESGVVGPVEVGAGEVFQLLLTVYLKFEYNDSYIMITFRNWVRPFLEPEDPMVTVRELLRDAERMRRVLKDTSEVAREIFREKMYWQSRYYMTKYQNPERAELLRTREYSIGALFRVVRAVETFLKNQWSLCEKHVEWCLYYLSISEDDEMTNLLRKDGGYKKDAMKQITKKQIARLEAEGRVQKKGKQV